VRVVRFLESGAPRWGLAAGEEITPLETAPWESGGTPLAAGAPVSRRGVTLLPPVAASKILAIGRNYRAHARELGNEVPDEPLVFYKAPSSLLAHGGLVVLPDGAGRVDYEGELAFVLGRRVRNAGRDEAKGAIFGLTCALDVSSRDWQKKDGQWWRAKSCDTFCPIGPAVVGGVDPDDLLLETLVDGEVRQSARTSEMVFDAAALVAHISRFMTLEAGDVILTGTPEGVAPLSSGQTVEVRIEKVGSLVVKVA
jgi:2-keto-4-pentenoate hydratase/2-oxohepta-3-ene-1,7-dioic acid hydratase in catechol pathway